MRIAIYSIEETLFEGEGTALIAKTPLGEISVLDNHLPMITQIMGPSVVILDNDNKKEVISIASGVLEIRPKSEAVILAEKGERNVRE
jgi:F0F1-type ATP synthase epsilon subunit